MSDSVNHKPQGRWEFDDDVTGCFDDMLARSIPQYADMRKAVFDLACRYRQPDTGIVDLGCSRGEAIAPLIEKYGMHNFFIGVESSEPMHKVCCERFAGYIRCKVAQIKHADLVEYYPPIPASVTLAVLTLQFIPLEYRQRVIAQAYEHTLPGGAFIMVEKILGRDDETDAVLVDRYYAMKADNGYSTEAIQAKRKSLEGVLVPIKAAWNEEMLHSAGFRKVECFWRWMNFAAWLAVKQR